MVWMRHENKASIIPDLEMEKDCAAFVKQSALTTTNMNINQRWGSNPIKVN
jgi:hypothetical protein